MTPCCLLQNNHILLLLLTVSMCGASTASIKDLVTLPPLDLVTVGQERELHKLMAELSAGHSLWYELSI